MPRFLPSILCLATTVTAAGFLAGCEPNSAQSVVFPHELSDLTPAADVVYGQLPNGLRYAVLENDTPTKTASIRLHFNTGSLNEGDDIQGLAHFLEHMAFNGSENIPEGEMVKTLERYGLAFGADTNAYTAFDETVYMLDLPEVTEEIFDVTLGIMRETASNLTLAQDAIDRERGVVQAEKRRRDSPGYRAQLHAIDFYLGESRIPDRLPIGEDDDLLSMSSSQFEAYYNGYYRPENAFLVIVGDVDTAFASAKISEYFSDWVGEGEALENKGAGEAGAHGLKTGFFADPDVQTSVSLSVMKPYEKQADTIENRRKSLIEGLGNRILNRRMATLARSETAEFISGGVSTSDMYEAGMISSLSMSSQKDKWQSALATGEQELRRALEFGFTQAELDEQLANTRKSLEVAVQTAETRRTASLASGLVNAYSGERVFTTPASGLERYDSYAATITTDEVWSAFKGLWEGLDEPLLYLTLPDAIENPDAQLLATWESSRSVAVSAPLAQETADFAYTDFGAPGEIVSRELIEPENIHSIKFANNVMLNIMKTDFDKDSIQINARFGGGFLSMPLDNPNVQQFAGYVMSAGGLEGHSQDDLQRILAGKAVGVSFNVGTKGFTLSGGTVPENLRDQLNLMTAYLTAPGYRPEAKSRYDKQVESWYPTLDSTPAGVAGRDIGRLIHSGDKRFGYPTQAEFLAVDGDQVRDWLAPHFESGQLEISVVGDMDVEEVIRQVAATFGALPARDDSIDAYAAARVLTFPPGMRRPVTLSHEGEQNRSMIRVYWPAPDGTDTTRSRRIGILQRIFSRRLTEVIREEEGAAYSPSAFRHSPEVYKDYGYIGLSLDLDPSDVDRMFKVVDGIAAEFKAGNFTQDEFDRVMTPVRENIETSLESNGYWMSVIAATQTDKDDLKNHREREAAYQNMTLSQLKPLAAQIFDESKAYRIQILPEG